MSRTVELLHSIDKTVGITSSEVASLRKSLDDHKSSDSKRRDKQEEWELRIEEAVKECPEAGHIRDQNGKIDKMMVLLRAMRLLLASIVILGVICSIIFGFLKLGNRGSDSIVPSTYVQEDD